MITLSLLKQMFKWTPEDRLANFVEPLNETCEKYDITTPERTAMFLAQVGHESGGLKYAVESIKMSAKRICQVWPSRFPTEADAEPYAYNPEKLANKVYANRMGNGPEDSGDGFRYRGRGLIQVTGKSNYKSFANSIGLSLDEVVDYLETFEGAAESAGWYWDSRALNSYADNGDIKGCTKKINGGYVGLADREALYQKALNLLT